MMRKNQHFNMVLLLVLLLTACNQSSNTTFPYSIVAITFSDADLVWRKYDEKNRLLD